MASIVTPCAGFALTIRKQKQTLQHLLANRDFFYNRNEKHRKMKQIEHKIIEF